MPGRVEHDRKDGYDRKAGQDGKVGQDGMVGQDGKDRQDGHDEGRSGRTGRTAKGAFGGENVATEDQKVRQCYDLGHFRAHGETGVSLNC